MHRYLLKRFQLRPLGAVQFVIFFNVTCLACYGMLFFFGCDNVKMAGTTMPYFYRSARGSFIHNAIMAVKSRAKMFTKIHSALKGWSVLSLHICRSAASPPGSLQGATKAVRLWRSAPIRTSRHFPDEISFCP